jgi:hypothetical protein
MQEDSGLTNTSADRMTLVRDIAVLQVKLVVDGLRDLILVPVSLIAGVISLVKSGEEQSSEFYDLLRIGRRSERWINLFGAAERVYGPASGDDQLLPEDIDTLVSRVESFVVDEYKKGGVTKQAKDRFDQALDTLHKRTRRNK